MTHTITIYRSDYSSYGWRCTCGSVSHYDLNRARYEGKARFNAGTHAQRCDASIAVDVDDTIYQRLRAEDEALAKPRKRAADATKILMNHKELLYVAARKHRDAEHDAHAPIPSCIVCAPDKWNVRMEKLEHSQQEADRALEDARTELYARA